MSSAASAVLSPSSSSSPGAVAFRQQPATATDLFSKYTPHDSPKRLPPANSALKNRSAPSGGGSGARGAASNLTNSRWRAVLEHLAPPRLLPVPKRAAPSAAASASPRQKVCVSRHASNSSPATLGEEASNAQDVAENLLETLLKKIDASMPEECGGQPAATLAELCTLCASAPDAADLCVDANGIDVILDVLAKSSTQLRQERPVSAEDFRNVDINEKALLLLQLLISSSHDGCLALLQHSSTLAVLGKKILRVSEASTASCINILSTLCRHSDAKDFRKAVSTTAIPSKLVVVLQVANKDSTKKKAGRLLRLLEDKQQEPPSITAP